jgi:hypothetical protein
VGVGNPYDVHRFIHHSSSIKLTRALPPIPQFAIRYCPVRIKIQEILYATWSGLLGKYDQCKACIYDGARKAQTAIWIGLLETYHRVEVGIYSGTRNIQTVIWKFTFRYFPTRITIQKAQTAIWEEMLKVCHQGAAYVYAGIHIVMRAFLKSVLPYYPTNTKWTPSQVSLSQTYDTSYALI